MMILRCDPCGITCVVFVYAAILYADYVTIAWLIQPTFDGSLWGVVHTGAFNILLGLLIAAHTRAMLSDPGIVPVSRVQKDVDAIDQPQHDTVQHTSDMELPEQKYRAPRRADDTGDDSDDSSTNDQQRYVGHPMQQARHLLAATYTMRPRHAYVGEDWTLCGRCDSYRPPRAHHCRICKRCVRRMDHHCPWVNNCVGEYNQKYFVQFLIYVGAASVYCLSLVACAWVWPCAHPPCADDGRRHMSPTYHTKVLHSIFVSIESALFCLFVVAVSCDQFQAILSDETAVEQVQRRGPHRPAKSRRALMQDVCGSGPALCWLLPCHDVPGRREFVHLPPHRLHDV